MKNKFKAELIFIIVSVLFFVNSYALANELAKEDIKVLSLYSIGFPTAFYQKDAWKINELNFFNNRLYIGYGDYGVNTGPTDVIYYDFGKKNFINEFTVQEEAIDKYKVVDKMLVIPGVDSTEDWNFGNIYVLEDKGWIKYRTVPNGIHVFDVVSFNNKWYIATGTNLKFSEKESLAPGVIMSSEDKSKSWNFEYSTPGDKDVVYRINSIIPYKDKLYGFIYAYTVMSKDDIPQSYRAYLGKPYTVQKGKEYYIVSVSDPLGSSDAVCYDEKNWQNADFINKQDIYRISPFVFNNKLIMSVISGKYITSVSDYIEQNGKLPDNVSTSLYTFDGQITRSIPFKYDIIKDILVKDDNLFLLFFKDKQNFIAKTSDLKNWEYYVLPASIKKPLSIEYDKNVFYIGTEDGNIFQSINQTQIKDLSQIKDLQPIKFYGGAQLPVNGKRYWAAITGWINWGLGAKFSCELTYGLPLGGLVTTFNNINIITDNIASMSIFPPLMQIDKNEPVILNIDGKEVFKDKLNGYTELICKYEKGKWEVEKGKGTAETFKPVKKIIGVSELDLSKIDADPLIGYWMTDVIKWAGNADIGINAKGAVLKGLKKGDIHIEDVFDITYKNSIVTFKVKGDKLKQMLEFNIKSPRIWERFQVTGFNFTYKEEKDSKNNTILSCFLEPDKEYVIATSDYLAKNAKDYFGQELDFKDSKIKFETAMVQWLQKFNKIEKIEVVNP